MAAATAPAILVDIEQSGLGAAIRQSTWAYATANTAHILTLLLFISAVVVMDLRLLGAFAATRPADVVVRSRRWAMVGLVGMAATGGILFVAEASHVAANPVFRVKLALIALALANAWLTNRALRATLDVWPADEPFPARIRAGALVSLASWGTVAACGRLIAYF